MLRLPIRIPRGVGGHHATCLRLKPPKDGQQTIAAEKTAGWLSPLGIPVELLQEMKVESSDGAPALPRIKQTDRPWMLATRMEGELVAFFVRYARRVEA